MKDDLLFDKRLIERHKKKGLLTDEQIREHLAKLEDDEKKSIQLHAERVRNRDKLN